MHTITEGLPIRYIATAEGDVLEAFAVSVRKKLFTPAEAYSLTGFDGPRSLQDGTVEDDFVEAVAHSDIDGSAVLAGHTYGSWSSDTADGSVSSDFAAVKLSSEGQEIWRWQVSACTWPTPSFAPSGGTSRGGPITTGRRATHGCCVGDVNNLTSADFGFEPARNMPIFCLSPRQSDLRSD